MHDPLAGGVAVDPSICGYLEKPVHVELRGTETRGMTAVDLRGYSSARAQLPGYQMVGENPRPDIKIAMEVDADRYLDEMVDRLSLE
jgi:inosine-uridine nucleoside N-ribohydrolase